MAPPPGRQQRKHLGEVPATPPDTWPCLAGAEQGLAGAVTEQVYLGSCSCHLSGCRGQGSESPQAGVMEIKGLCLMGEGRASFGCCYRTDVDAVGRTGLSLKGQGCVINSSLCPLWAGGADFVPRDDNSSDLGHLGESSFQERGWLVSPLCTREQPLLST